MAQLIFPGAPTPGQVFVGTNGVSYTWDNTLGVWTAAGSGGGGGSGTVTSVGVSGSQGIQVVSGSPVTSAGTIALTIDVSTLPPIP